MSNRMEKIKINFLRKGRKMTAGEYIDFSKELVSKLKKSLSDLNFFVRKNSAQSLFSIIGKQEIFDETIKNSDPFARDVLNYMIENTNLSGYGEYKKILSLEARKSKLDALLASGGL